MPRPFQQVDVFGARPLAGNPLAVVHDATGLSSEAMQHLARWTNLSETAFLLPPEHPEGDYRVRIFTLTQELPFAGHPTLGSCHAWLEAGGRPRDPEVVVQECGAGMVRVRRDDGGLAFAAPPLLRTGPVEDDLLDDLAAVLDLEPGRIVDACWADNGPGWVALLLPDAASVLAVEPRVERWTRAGSLDVGLVGPLPAGGECAFEVRALFTDHGGQLREDPVTGSLNASVAAWLLDTGRANAPYVASQGTRLGRAGHVRITRDTDGTVWVGGATATVVRGSIDLGGSAAP